MSTLVQTASKDAKSLLKQIGDMAASSYKPVAQGLMPASGLLL